MIGERRRVAELTEPLVGFRTFAVGRDSNDDELLRSTFVPTWWHHNQAVARCHPLWGQSLTPRWWRTLGRRAGFHVPPEPRCRCGLYAFNEPIPYGKVTAAVVAWGRVCLHRSGFRAERMRILGFATGADASLTERLGRRYRVPVMPLADLRAHASEFGTPAGEL